MVRTYLSSANYANGEQRIVMKLKLFHSCLLFFVALPLFARDKSDILVMRNGDHLACEIKSLDADTLSISLDYAEGTISIDWAKSITLKASSSFL
jgi:hypothetical protein